MTLLHGRDPSEGRGKRQPGPSDLPHFQFPVPGWVFASDSGIHLAMPVMVGVAAIILGLVTLTLAIVRGMRRARTWIILSAALVIGGIVMTALSFRDFDPDQVPLSSLPEAPASGGRQLRSDRTVVAAWRELRWAPGRLRLEVPADWNERRNDGSELDLRPNLQTTFVTAQLSSATKMTPEDFLRVARVQAASRLAASRIVGYSVKTLGAASGVLSFERSKDDTKEQLVWTSLVPGTNQVITIFLGAATENFAQTEPVLGAILESMRIE